MKVVQVRLVLMVENVTQMEMMTLYAHVRPNLQDFFVKKEVSVYQ